MLLFIHQNEKLFIFSFSMILENQGCYFRWRPTLGFPKLQVLFANPSVKFMAVGSFPVVGSQWRHNRNTVLFSSSKPACVARTFARPISGIGEEKRRRKWQKTYIYSLIFKWRISSEILLGVPWGASSGALDLEEKSAHVIPTRTSESSCNFILYQRSSNLVRLVDFQLPEFLSQPWLAEEFWKVHQSQSCQVWKPFPYTMGVIKCACTYKPGMWQGDHIWLPDTGVP